MTTLLWFDNFESYPAGANTITAPWVNTGPAGPSFPDSQISTLFYHSPVQSLGVGIGGGSAEGAGWVQRSILYESGQLGPVWTVDLWVYMPSGTGIPDPPESNAPGFLLQQTSSDSTVRFYMGGDGTCFINAGTGFPSTNPWHSFSLTLDTWHHLNWVVDMSVTGTSVLTTDGGAPSTFSGDTRTEGGGTNVDLFQIQGQFIVASPAVEILFDDVSVYEGVFPSIPPVPIACGNPHTASEITPVWSDTGDEPYVLRYRVNGTSVWTQINNINATSFTITGLQASTEYEWQVSGNTSSSFGPSGFCFTDASPFTFLACQNGWTVTQPVTQVWGFDHLIGIAVTGLIDGIVLPPQVVAADGSITFPFPASNWKIGLSFLPQLQTVRLDAGSPTVQGRRKAVSALTARLNKSGQPQLGTNQIDGSATTPQSIGPAWSNMTTVPLQPQQGTQPQSVLTYLSPSGQPVTILQTGDIRTTVNDSWAKPGQLAIQQPLPLPLEVLSVMPELLEGDITEQGFAQEQKPQQHPDHRRQHQGPGTWMLRR